LLLKPRRYPRIFFGWYTAVVAGSLNLWAAGYYSYGISALFLPISAELGLSRTVVSTAASIGRMEGGFEAPLMGWLTDKYGPKWLIFGGVALAALGLLLMYFVNSVWTFFLFWGVLLGTGHNVTMGVPVQKAVANWFVKKRGLASGTMMVFSGLSGMLVLPLIAWLITVVGWRMSLVIGGAVMGLVGLPLVWFFIKEQRPEYYGLLPDGASVGEETADAEQMIARGVKYAAEVDEVEFTLRQAIRTPPFWLLIVAGAGTSLALPALTIHGVPFLVDTGVAPVVAAGMVAIMAGASIPGRLAGGYIADRIGKNYLRFAMAGAYLMQGIGTAIFLLNQSLAMVYVWFIVYGFGLGVGIGFMQPMRARYFGRKALGSIGGWMALGMLPSGVAAPIYLGWVFDKTGSYISAFWIIAGILLISAIFSFFILPPRLPAVMSETGQTI